jgi:ubiquinone/menaquinone biosynthesis C-methylase UbiE
VGCGTGILLERLHRTGRYEQLVGIEPTENMREQAAQRLGEEVEILAASAEMLPFESGSFDLVVSTNMLHYCHPVEDVLEEMVRVLRPGGVLVLTDWSGDSPSMKALCLILRRFKGIQARAHSPHRLTALLQGMNAQLTREERFRVFPWWRLFCNAYLLERNTQDSDLT